MSSAVCRDLAQVLKKIDRPGSFCASGSVPVVLPGLEVEGLGPIGLPLTTPQAKELKKHCEQAPYGKGEETLVDTSVRRVWRLKPERFALTNPDWEVILQEIVCKVEEELGLEGRNLQSHLYDLLLYEPDGFFLPHRDGEKLYRMAATLVVVLPSPFQGGELVVRHDQQEQTIDFGNGEDNRFRIYFAAFYADCEHEIRPLREGYRLCLVYNLTLGKGKKIPPPPHSSDTIEPIRRILSDWSRQDEPRKLAVTLKHQYTQDGLTWDALKGEDRSTARVLLAGAQQADCRAYLALLTFHETGAAEYADGYSGRSRRWGDDDEDAEEEDSSEYEMVEVIDSSLIADHWSDPEGRRLPFGTIGVEEEELLDPDKLQAVVPQEEFEGYTGNEGMTLDRWYRHGAIFLWPNKRHYPILCDAGSRSAVESLQVLVKQWQAAGKKDAAALRAECLTFAAAIVATWSGTPYTSYFDRREEPVDLLPLLTALDEPGLIKRYLIEVLSQDVAVDPGKALAQVCQKHGWGTFRRELEDVFQRTTRATIERNIGVLEQLCSAKPRKREEWIELCSSLAQATVEALERVDQEKEQHDYRMRNVDGAKVLTGLARSLLITEQDELLERVVAHTLARPEKYPLTPAHVTALTTLGPWLAKHVKKSRPALAHWIDFCCAQLESLTAEMPQPSADFRRPAEISCKCEDCKELRRFLNDPNEQVARFSVREDRRKHLQHRIREYHCDLDLKTEQLRSPYSLVCTKNSASYQAKLKKYHEDQEHLARLRSIQRKLPG